jgi:hypothetical protein
MTYSLPYHCIKGIILTPFCGAAFLFSLGFDIADTR